jgi:hypothetical protein
VLCLFFVWFSNYLPIFFQRNKERRAIRFGPPANLKLLEIMFEKSKVSELSACIPRQGEEINPVNLDDFRNMETQDIGESSHRKEHAERGTKRKGVNRPNKKAKNPMVRVMSKIDDVISTNSVTSKAIQGDFMKEDIRETMKLAKEVGAIEGTDEHYIATRLFVKSKNRWYSCPSYCSFYRDRITYWSTSLHFTKCLGYL